MGELYTFQLSSPKVITTQTCGYSGGRARRVIRLQCSRFRRQGFGLKSLRKRWSIRTLKSHGISPQALTATVCRSCSSALKVKLTSFAILASALKALANPIAEASPNANENV